MTTKISVINIEFQQETTGYLQLEEMRAEKAKIKATFRTEHSVHQRQADEDGSSPVLPEDNSHG